MRLDGDCGEFTMGQDCSGEGEPAPLGSPTVALPEDPQPSLPGPSSSPPFSARHPLTVPTRSHGSILSVAICHPS